ncbi:MAG: hemolysin III family protein [Cellvibrionales bacterium]|nr:hemolysin III family protein [Cellvibrionales bacterium]
MGTYSDSEERLNIFSHFLGLLLSIVAAFFLILKAFESGKVIAIVSYSLYGLSLICLYTASTFYHKEKDSVRRKHWKVVDHAAIYLLIAGTYTPFTLITLDGKVGWMLFTVTWMMALAGVILKLFFTGRYVILSTLLYLLTGWTVIFALPELLARFAEAGVRWLVAGGLLYTLGALLYLVKSLPYNHAIFHCCVLLASTCHFIAVYCYVII